MLSSSNVGIQESIETSSYLLSRKIITEDVDSFLVSNNYLTITIKMRPNNIFCCIRHSNSPIFTRTFASGFFNLKTTRRNLDDNLSTMLRGFLKKLFKYYKSAVYDSDFIVFQIETGKEFRVDIVDYFESGLTNLMDSGKPLIFSVDSPKEYNGCRARKARRKKGAIKFISKD